MEPHKWIRTKWCPLSPKIIVLVWPVKPRECQIRTTLMDAWPHGRVSFLNNSSSCRCVPTVADALRVCFDLHFPLPVSFWADAAIISKAAHLNMHFSN